MYRIIAVITLVAMLGMGHADAAQLDAQIAGGSEEFVPTYQFTRIITIYHNEDSELRQMIGDDERRISFEIGPGNSGALIDAINEQLSDKSFATIAGLSGSYAATILPQGGSTGIEYRIVLEPVIKDYYIGDSFTIDSQWRGFAIDGPIPVDTEYGTYDINRPMSALSTIPGVEEFLSSAGPVEILEIGLVDAQGLADLPLAQWESLFDPTSEMTESKGYGFQGNVITNFSMGICTVYLGICQDRDLEETFSIEDEQYRIRSIESQDDGTIVIEGYVDDVRLGQAEAFEVRESAPLRGGENDTQVPLIYIVSGIGAAVAVGFFVWSGRKAKSTSSEQTGIDPKDLSAVAIGSAAGSYRTNRGTAELSG